MGKKIKEKIWQTLSSKVVHKNPWFHVAHDTFVTPVQTIGNYYVIHSNGGSNKSVLIIPILDGKILLTRQYRYVAKKRQIELPGGGVKPEHTSVRAAREELEEELGYKAKKLIKVGSYRPYSGPLPEITSVYIASDLVETTQHLEETEIGLTIMSVTVSDVYDMIADGRINDGQTIAALAIARKHLEKM